MEELLNPKYLSSDWIDERFIDKSSPIYCGGKTSKGKRKKK